jgi:hypothetical protein
MLYKRVARRRDPPGMYITARRLTCVHIGRESYLRIGNISFLRQSPQHEEMGRRHFKTSNAMSTQPGLGEPIYVK